MIRVVIESPFAGDRVRNKAYLIACMRDCFRRGESCYASHGYIPDALNDDDPAERSLGMWAGWAWLAVAELQVVYVDLGISRGMADGIVRAKTLGIPSEERRLGGEWAVPT